MLYYIFYAIKIMSPKQNVQVKLVISFRASFHDYVLTSYCSNVACQLMNVETCSKTCASFLPMCIQL